MTWHLTIYVCEIFFLIAQLFLAGKDASSYLLKDRTADPLQLKRIARWHRDGLILACLYALPCLYISLEKVGLKGLLCAAGLMVMVRLSVYDIAFNLWAGLPLYYFGSTPKADGLFARIFGKQGAVRKCLAFAIVLITLQFFL